MSQEFRALLTAAFEAEVILGEDAVNDVNRWVAEKTRNKITKLVDSVPGDLVAVILNAIYFKGAWERPFLQQMTEKLPFRLDTGEQVDVNTMVFSLLFPSASFLILKLV